MRGFVAGIISLTSIFQAWTIDRDPSREALIEFHIPALMECNLLSEQSFVLTQESDHYYEQDDAITISLSANGPWQVGLTPKNLPKNSTLSAQMGFEEKLLTLPEHQTTLLMQADQAIQSKSYPININYRGKPNTPNKPIELHMVISAKARKHELQEMQKLLRHNKQDLRESHPTTK